MNKRYNSIERLDIKECSSPSKNILHLGGQNIVLGSKFDIKRYFTEMEKKNDKSPKKTNKISLFYPIISPKNRKLYNISTDSNDNSTSKYKNQNYNTIDNELINNYKNIYNFNHSNSNHSSKNIYQNCPIRNNTIGIKDNNCFLTSLGIEQSDNKNTINKFNTIGAKDYLISYNSNNSNNNRYKRLFSNNNRKLNKNYHVDKIIKEIREKYKTKDSLDIKSDYLAYTSQNMDAVLDANYIINNYKEKNDWDLKLKENNIHNFMKNNKKIFKQNIFTKLILNEKEKVLENGILNEKRIIEKKIQLLMMKKNLKK